MATPDTPRSALASLVGWAIVAVVAWWLLGAVLGTVLWVVRSLVWVVIVGGLIWAYLALKAPSDE
jgi:hypothetical protein